MKFKGQTKVLKDLTPGIMARLKTLESKPYVKVGVLESAGDKQTDIGTAAGLTVAQVATFHEFGTERTPERPFIRTTMTEKEAELMAETKRLRDDVIFKGMSTFKALSLLGLKIQSAIKKKITEGDPAWPALAQSTIDAKGSDKPLIDTGQLRNSIQYEVVNKS